MGISYSLVKSEKPEAWEIGKDYLDFKAVFPPCSRPMHDKKSPLPLIRMLARISNYHIVGSTPFKITDLYPTLESFEGTLAVFVKDKDPVYIESLKEMYVWAGSDELQFIPEFDDLDARDAADEYKLCDVPRNYKHVDNWNGQAGRAVGYDEDEE